jgi:hypothetical protein
MSNKRMQQLSGNQVNVKGASQELQLVGDLKRWKCNDY